MLRWKQNLPLQLSGLFSVGQMRLSNHLPLTKSSVKVYVTTGTSFSTNSLNSSLSVVRKIKYRSCSLCNKSSNSSFVVGEETEEEDEEDDEEAADGDGAVVGDTGGTTGALVEVGVPTVAEGDDGDASGGGGGG